jgi:RNA polymerase sigma-70 factor (ECF subfamily)
MQSSTKNLSDLVTEWTVVLRAVSSSAPDAAAMAEVLPRYCEAVHLYLQVLLEDRHAADDVCQEFAYRFARGDFRHVRPENGRFRDYVKVSLINMVHEHRRKLARDANRKLIDLDLIPAPELQTDEKFEAACRTVLIERTWTRVAFRSGAERPSLFEVLRRKAETPLLTSEAIAQQLSGEFGRPFTAANVRQMIHRARKLFAEELRVQVLAILPAEDRAAIDEELARLGLLSYCGPAG